MVFGAQQNFSVYRLCHMRAFSINIIFTHRKSIVDWYVRKENKRWIKKNGNRIIEKQTKEAKVVMNTIYSNYPNAILLESNCPPVKELELLKIIYPAIGEFAYTMDEFQNNIITLTHGQKI